MFTRMCPSVTSLPVLVKRLVVSNEWQTDGYITYRRGFNRNGKTELDDTKNTVMNK
jgi:hypothetical protein